MKANNRTSLCNLLQIFPCEQLSTEKFIKLFTKEELLQELIENIENFVRKFQDNCQYFISFIFKITFNYYFHICDTYPNVAWGIKTTEETNMQYVEIWINLIQLIFSSGIEDENRLDHFIEICRTFVSECATCCEKDMNSDITLFLHAMCEMFESKGMWSSMAMKNTLESIVKKRTDVLEALARDTKKTQERLTFFTQEIQFLIQ